MKASEKYYGQQQELLGKLNDYIEDNNAPAERDAQQGHCLVSAYPRFTSCPYGISPFASFAYLSSIWISL